jgi:Protein of unknown function (DUF2630)
MDDKEVLERIHTLVAEEDVLHTRATGEGLSAEEHDRIKHIDAAIDQCWDLLRQRRALRDAGANPDQAHVRSVDVVERYDQ